MELLRKAMGALECFMTVLMRAYSPPQGRKGAGRVEAAWMSAGNRLCREQRC